MAFDEALLPYLMTKRFWADYFFLADVQDHPDRQDRGYEDLGSSGLVLRLGDGIEVAIEVDPFMENIPLLISAAGESKVEIGNDDRFHWSPHVLRWDEVELICRAASCSEPGLISHPGPALLFLSRFAPICVGDDEARIVAMLDAAWRTVGGFSDAEIRRMIERLDFRGAKFEWFHDDETDCWWIGQGMDQDHLTLAYTRRCMSSLTDDRNGAFPHDVWKVLLAAAERVVAGTPEAAASLPSPTYSLRRQRGFDLELALRDPDRPLHPRSARYLYKSLDRVLRNLDLGDAETSGSRSTTVDGKNVTETHYVHVMFYGDDADFKRGVRILRDMLWWMGAPASTAQRVSDGFRAVRAVEGWDLGKRDCMSEPVGGGGESATTERETSYLGICNAVGDKLDTLTLPLYCLERLCVVLRGGEHRSGPTAEGWITVTSADDGELGFNFSKFPEDSPYREGTGTLALRKVTPGVTAILHRFMLASGMAVLPCALTAKALPAEAKSPWPSRHRVETAERLYEILMDGPYKWWVGSKTGAEEGSAGEKGTDDGADHSRGKTSEEEVGNKQAQEP